MNKISITILEHAHGSEINSVRSKKVQIKMRNSSPIIFCMLCAIWPLIFGGCNDSSKRGETIDNSVNKQTVVPKKEENEKQHAERVALEEVLRRTKMTADQLKAEAELQDGEWYVLVDAPSGPPGQHWYITINVRSGKITDFQRGL